MHGQNTVEYIIKGIDQVYSDMLSGGEAQEEAQGTY